jgi:methylamine dehydrogenase accessory protein MauD
MTDALLVSNVLLWIAVVVLAAVVVALVRQIGLLHERVFPVGALMTAGGPRVGEAAPELGVPDLAGRTVHVGGAHDGGRATLVFFVSPTCPVCKTLLPIVLDVAATETPPARVVLASDGEPAEHRAFVERAGLDGVPYVLSSALGLAYQVAKLPYAVLIDARGVLRGKGIVNTREHVESLFEAARLGVASMQDYLRRHDENPPAPATRRRTA